LAVLEALKLILAEKKLYKKTTGKINKFLIEKCKLSGK
jgi:hypothetical protein